MTSENRIQATSIVSSVERQTPNNDFGAVLARTVGEVVRRGVAFVGGAISQVPVASAAVGVVPATASAVRELAESGVIPTVVRDRDGGGMGTGGSAGLETSS